MLSVQPFDNPFLSLFNRLTVPKVSLSSLTADD
jgi:hypothetical protein